MICSKSRSFTGPSTRDVRTVVLPFFLRNEFGDPRDGPARSASISATIVEELSCV